MPACASDAEHPSGQATALLVGRRRKPAKQQRRQKKRGKNKKKHINTSKANVIDVETPALSSTSANCGGTFEAIAVKDEDDNIKYLNCKSEDLAIVPKKNDKDAYNFFFHS